MMKLSFSSLGNPKLPLPQFMALLKPAGYDAMELRGRPNEHVHWQDSPARRQEVRKMFADAGLEIAAVSTYLFLASRDSGGPTKPDTRNEPENIEELKRWVDLAADLGAPNVRVFGGAVSQGETHETALPRVVRIMAAGAKVNKSVNICLETHDVWNTSTIVKAVLDAAGGRNCKALWDVHGTESAHEVPADVVKTIGARRIAYLHVKDGFPMLNHPQPGETKHYQVLIGAGQTPIRQIIKALKRARWSGYVNVEWEGIYNPYMPPVEVAAVQAALKLREFMAE